jgi:hypothetical protein
MASRVEAIALYRSLVRSSKQFANYNFREYFLRRTRCVRGRRVVLQRWQVFCQCRPRRTRDGERVAVLLVRPAHFLMCVPCARPHSNVCNGGHGPGNGIGVWMRWLCMSACVLRIAMSPDFVRQTPPRGRCVMCALRCARCVRMLIDLVLAKSAPLYSLIRVPGCGLLAIKGRTSVNTRTNRTLPGSRSC